MCKFYNPQICSYVVEAPGLQTAYLCSRDEQDGGFSTPKSDLYARLQKDAVALKIAVQTALECTSDAFPRSIGGVQRFRRPDRCANPRHTACIA